MGTYIPPVTSGTQPYISDANVMISVEKLRERYREYRLRNVTQLPYFSLMEFGGGPPRYAMRCPTDFSGKHRAVSSKRARLQDLVPPSATTGPVNIHKCSEVPVGPDESYLVWQQINISGTSAVQFRLNHTVPGERGLCLQAVHDSGPTYNDELDVRACNASSRFQRWKWISGGQLMSAMTQAEKDSVWAGRRGRCNGAVKCCLQVNADRAVDGQVLDGAVCGAGCPSWKVVAQPGGGGGVTIEGQATRGFEWLKGYCIAFSRQMPRPTPPPPPPLPPPPPPRDQVPWHQPNEYHLRVTSISTGILT
jgi:hypothetical protein